MFFIILLASVFLAVRFGIFAGILTSIVLLFVFKDSIGLEGANLNTKEKNQLFITNLFGLFGHMAKAKGKVEKVDLAAALDLMNFLNLTSDEDVNLAKKAFNDGKKEDFDFESVLQSIKSNFHNNANILNIVLDVLIQASLIDGKIEPAEMQLLLKTSSILGFSKYQLEILINAHLNRAFNYNSHANYKDDKFESRYNAKNYDTLETAYAILELDKSATFAEAKKQYKRMISKNHPDKLIAKGMPKNLIEVAKEKTQRINNAYDIICKAKGW